MGSRVVVQRHPHRPARPPQPSCPAHDLPRVRRVRQPPATGPHSDDRGGGGGCGAAEAVVHRHAESGSRRIADRYRRLGGVSDACQITVLEMEAASAPRDSNHLAPRACPRIRGSGLSSTDGQRHGRGRGPCASARGRARAAAGDQRGSAGGRSLGRAQPVLDEIVEAASDFAVPTTARCFCSRTAFSTLSRMRPRRLRRPPTTGSIRTPSIERRQPAAMLRAPVHIPDIHDDPEYAYAGPRTLPLDTRGSHHRRGRPARCRSRRASGAAAVQRRAHRARPDIRRPSRDRAHERPSARSG